MFFLRIACTHHDAEESGTVKVTESNPEHYCYRNGEDCPQRPPYPGPESQCYEYENRAEVKVCSLNTRLYEVTHKLLDSQVEQEDNCRKHRIGIELNHSLDGYKNYYES